MLRYLIVANRTLGGEKLWQVIEDCASRGPCEFHVVVPASPTNEERYVWTEGAAIAAARTRLEAMLKRLADAGLAATGEVGDQTPLDAIKAALRDRTVDEIILSTLPPGGSRWLHQDLPRRVQRAFPHSVRHVISTADSASATA